MHLQKAVVLPLRAWQALQVEVQGTDLPPYFSCQGYGASEMELQLLVSSISIADSLWQATPSARSEAGAALLTRGAAAHMLQLLQFSV